MSHSGFDRVAAGGGAAFTVLALSTFALAPAAPAADAPAGRIRAYLADNHDRFAVTAVVMAVAAMALTLAFAHVHRRLAEDDEGTSLPGAFTAAASATVAVAFIGALLPAVLTRFGAAGLDDSALVVLHRMWYVVALAGPPLPMAVVLLLAGVRTVQRGLFPRWTGWVALVAAVAGAATSVVNLGTSQVAPAALDLGAFLLTCLWLTGISVHAWTGRPATDTATGSRTAART